jgi:glutamine synthetase
VIEDIIEGKTSPANAEQAMIQMGIDKLPDIQKDNTDRNRTSPFAFTGNKFEFRAVGSSASIAFPVAMLNAAVAEACGELAQELREELKKTSKVDDAVFKVVRKAFKESTPVLFEGNNYSDEWVKDAEKRGLLNLRRTPQALAQLVTKQSRKLLTSLGIFTEEEIDSRYHVRLERYIKDMQIELNTLREMVDTLVLPAAYEYAGQLGEAAANAKAAGIKAVPQVEAANRVGALISELESARSALLTAIEKADKMHDNPEKLAEFLTSKGADAMAEARRASDALEGVVSDDLWPLPKYREMLFPV